jgi:exopolysaccharide production protein ExoQ
MKNPVLVRRLDQQMNIESSKRNIDGIILFFAFILANLRASIFIHLDPDTSVLLGPAWIEIALWFFLVLVMIYRLMRNNQITDYLLVWRRNWLIVLFLLLAFVSVFWSVDPVVTMFRFWELALATLIGVYIGTRYHPIQLMEFLFWFGAILLIASVAMVFAAPKTGTMYWPPFDGAWRGLFWHRNHLGSMTALLSVVFLARAILAFGEKNGRGMLDVFFYLLSLIVLFFTKSATGYILLISLNILVACIWLWLKVYPRLRAWHYSSILGVFSLGLVLILSNLDVVFGLFNRDTTLTGRVGLWNYLLHDVVPRRLWWGHGFGAVWTLDAFREDIRQHVGWASDPLIADNGFLDILLHVGVVGLVIFMVILIILVVRSIRYAISKKRLSDFFPLLFVGYVLIANIPFSLFAETEVFVWFLLVALLFMTTPPLHTANEGG